MLSTSPLANDPATNSDTIARERRTSAWAVWVAVVALPTAHSLAIWFAMGGWAGLNNGWPLWRHDHPLYFHSALVTRHFLHQNGTTAGYDPSFMSGYAKSVVFPSSSTLPELIVALFGGQRPEFAYKVYVLASAALVPWLVLLAGALCRIRPGALALSLPLYVLYVWTDFPINYAGYGMLPYFLGIPLALVASALVFRYLEAGGTKWWVASALGMIVAVMVHFTTAMVIVPAVTAAYLAAIVRARASHAGFSNWKHVGFWLIPIVVLVANGFWWVPGIWLSSTKGPSNFAFVNADEEILTRLSHIWSTEPAVQSLVLVIGLVGLALCAKRDRLIAVGLAVFAGAGFFWGYLAAGVSGLGFLQPGRHTFAFFTVLALASGIALAEAAARLRAGPRYRLDIWVALGLLSIGGRVFGPECVIKVKYRITGLVPFLSSEPSKRMLWVLDRVKRHVKPGERLLYEEGGFSTGVPDPFQGGRFSGLLPWRTGVEVIGGPYLHASLTTNFTQFGEGKLFGRESWGLPYFQRYARLYRPSAIVCWSPDVKRFCRSFPDLIEVVEEEGGVLIGRVKGFEGATITGQAEVEASPGRLTVRNATAGLDGRVVLRYHSVPCLRTEPPVDWEPVSLEGDPVPFIGLRPPRGAVTLELKFPPGRGSHRGVSEPRAD